jgi:hypothetical protein
MCDQGASGEAGPQCRETEAGESELVRAPRWAPRPEWLRPSDLDALADRFAPLDVAQARHLAFVLAEGSTPVEVLIMRLTAAGLALPDARRFIAELRSLREQTRRPNESRRCDHSS